MPERASETPWVMSVPIVVSDSRVSKKWYTEKLGLTLIADRGHWVTVGGREKGSVLHLCQASDMQPAPVPLEPGFSGIVIAIPGDFEAECRRLKEAGVEFTRGPEKADYGWYARVRDPDGNEHRLSPAPT